METVQRGGRVLACVCNQLQNDKAIVSAAVKQKGCSLKFAFKISRKWRSRGMETFELNDLCTICI